jgi:hypothetical protein
MMTEKKELREEDFVGLLRKVYSGGSEPTRVWADGEVVELLSEWEREARKPGLQRLKDMFGVQ